VTPSLDLDEVRDFARQGETFPDWTLAMADEIERLRWRLDDRIFDATDRRLTRLLTFLGGAAFGVAVSFIAVWVTS
jgi:hypothetical protein